MWSNANDSAVNDDVRSLHELCDGILTIVGIHIHSDRAALGLSPCSQTLQPLCFGVEQRDCNDDAGCSYKFSSHDRTSQPVLPTSHKSSWGRCRIQFSLP